MFTVKEPRKSQQFSARNSINFDYMVAHPLQLERKPYFPTPTPTELQGSDIGQPNRVAIENRFLEVSHCAFERGVGVPDKPSDVCRVPQKRFLCFDQSVDGTRLFFSPQVTPLNHIISSKALVSSDGPFEKVAEQPQIVTNPLFEEEHWDENDEEMREDTEEINALLYSDSDDEYEDNDEVTSTGHTGAPFATEEDYYNDRDNLIEHGSSKRQRLIDGKYEKSSVLGPSESLMYSNRGDMESSSDDLNSIKREKKVKIRRALEILKSIIPGAGAGPGPPSNDDYLSIIENAIVYLKTMKKSEAEAMLL